MVDLLDGIKSDESTKLAKVLKDADLIPKLYQYAYVESVYKVLSKFKNYDDFKNNLKFGFGNEKFILETHTPYDAVNAILSKAHERQNEICDFEDSPLPDSKIGRCQDENHYEYCEQNVGLTEDEQEEFEKISEDKGWSQAWDHFKDKINPDNQKLTLILNSNDDETKVIKDDGFYICETCLDVLRDESDGGISCDLEMADDVE